MGAIGIVIIIAVAFGTVFAAQALKKRNTEATNDYSDSQRT